MHPIRLISASDRATMWQNEPCGNNSIMQPGIFRQSRFVPDKPLPTIGKLVIREAKCAASELPMVYFMKRARAPCI